jgi:hypothetical protein
MEAGQMLSRAAQAAFQLTPTLVADAMARIAVAQYDNLSKAQMRSVVRSAVVSDTFAFIVGGQTTCCATARALARPPEAAPPAKPNQEQANQSHAIQAGASQPVAPRAGGDVATGAQSGADDAQNKQRETDADPCRDLCPLWHTKSDQTSGSGETTATPGGEDIGGVFVWFLIVQGVSLMLGRALSEARLTFYAPRSDTPHDPSVPRPREMIIAYPRWVAAIVYAVILLPATYLAVGSLLMLTQGQAPVDVEKFREQLDKAEANATSSETISKVTINTEAMMSFAMINLAKLDADEIKDFKSTPGSSEPHSIPAKDTPMNPDEKANIKAQVQNIQNGINNYYTISANFEKFRYSEKAKYVERFIIEYKKMSPTSLVEYSSNLTEKYYNAVFNERSEQRACLQPLDNIEGVITDRNNGNKQSIGNLPAAKTFTDQLPGKCPVQRIPDKQDNLNGNGRIPTNIVDKNAGSVLENVLFPWMVGMPSTTQLIVGMFGFGLFGAAIRMLGRPDRTEAQVDTSRSSIPAEIRKLVTELMKLAADFPGKKKSRTSPMWKCATSPSGSTRCHGWITPTATTSSISALPTT